MGNVLSVYMEAFEKGYTNSDGNLNWGDHQEMVTLIPKIAGREGVGDILADGAENTA
jgi:aldehyde:ferredoxin oxidoreductase